MENQPPPVKKELPPKEWIHGELDRLTRRARKEYGGNPDAPIDQDFLLGVTFFISKIYEQEEINGGEAEKTRQSILDLTAEAERTNKRIFRLTLWVIAIGLAALVLQAVEMCHHWRSHSGEDRHTERVQPPATQSATQPTTKPSPSILPE